MSFFDDQDPFEDILRDFFGRSASPVSNSEEIISGEDDERIIDFIEIRENTLIIDTIPYASGWMEINKSCVKLDRKINKNDILYVHYEN